MRGRPVDRARRAELLEAAVDYAIDRGVSGLTLRPLADGLGVSANTLVHHFGTKDELLSAILNGVRARLLGIHAALAMDADLQPLEGVWRWASDPDRTELFRSFFEAYGLALRDPDRFRPFLDRVVADWLEIPTPGQNVNEQPPNHRLAKATIELALVRGLLLDLLTTGDRDRVNAAFELFASGQRGMQADSDANA